MDLSSSEDESSSSTSCDSDIVRARSFKNSIQDLNNNEKVNCDICSDDDSDFDDVEWEDADIEEDEEVNNTTKSQHAATPKKFPYKAVTIELDNPITTTTTHLEKTNKKRTRQLRKIHNVSPQL